MKAAFRYVTSNKGVNSATHYPYRARVSTHTFKFCLETFCFFVIVRNFVFLSEVIVSVQLKSVSS